MPQDFYTLEEAAERLGLSTDKLNDMSKKREVRSFMDRGTLRFRRQEIEELARRMGQGSDPELQLADSGGKAQAGEDVFPFRVEADDDADVFSLQGEKKKGPPGSDSDVRLVPEGSDVDIKSRSEAPKTLKTDSSKIRGGRREKSGDSSSLLESDSDVILADADSSISLGRDDRRSPSDSDVRVEPPSSGRLAGSGPKVAGKPPSSKRIKPGANLDRTDEINLDDELRKAEEASRHSKMSMKPSPFELSGESKSRKPDSSEFDLPPAKKSGSALDSSSEEIALDIGSSDVNDLLTAADSDLTVQAESSGISLHDPSDKGIALDESDETINFDLSVEESPAATPNPSARSPKAKPSPKAKAADSSSEFELTLEDEGAAAPVKKKGRTDMVVPGLEESDIGLKTEDSDLGSSDFELALEGEEVGSESESGSEVIVLDDAGEGDATAVAPPGDLEGEEITEIVDEAPPSDLEAGDEVEVAAEDEGVTVPAGVAAPPAEWGWWSLVHVPTALVLIFVGFLMFEMLRSIWSYGQPSTLGGVVFNFFDKHMK